MADAEFRYSDLYPTGADDTPYRKPRTVLAGGVGLFLLGIADRVDEDTTNDRVSLARLGTVVHLVPVTVLSSLLSSLVFTAKVSLILLALTLYQTLGAEPPEG